MCFRASFVKFAQLCFCAMNRKITVLSKVAAVCITAVLLSACDWIRAKLDMPTSEDIALKRELIAEKEAQIAKLEAEKDTILAQADTTRLSVADSVQLSALPAGSVSGSASGSVSGSASGSASGATSGSASGSTSSSTSGSVSGSTSSSASGIASGSVYSSQSGSTAGTSLQLVPRSSLTKTYYIIVGAFKTDELVLASIKEHTDILEPPMAFTAGGLKYVAIGGYETLEEARKALYTVLPKVPNAWVYKKNG